MRQLRLLLGLVVVNGKLACFPAHLKWWAENQAYRNFIEVWKLAATRLETGEMAKLRNYGHF